MCPLIAAEGQAMQWIPLLPRGAVVLSLSNACQPPNICLPIWDATGIEYILVNVTHRNCSKHMLHSFTSRQHYFQVEADMIDFDVKIDEAVELVQSKVDLLRRHSCSPSRPSPHTSEGTLLDKSVNRDRRRWVAAEYDRRRCTIC